MPSIRSRIGRLFTWQPSSVVTKVMLLCCAFFVLFSLFLLYNFYLTGTLVGTGTAINRAGSERMRIYHISYLVERMNESSLSGHALTRQIADEMTAFERYLEELRLGTDEYAALGEISPLASKKLEEVQRTWGSSLKPLIQEGMDAPIESRGRLTEALQTNTEQVVGILDEMVEELEHDVDSHQERLYRLQFLFLLLSTGGFAMAFYWLHRMLRHPLQRLMAGAEALASEASPVTIPVQSHDELGQLARQFEWASERIWEKITVLDALHTTSQEITSLWSGGSDQVLQRIAYRATRLISVEKAVLLGRHPVMDYWIVEAVSDGATEMINRKILLEEEMHSANQCFQTRSPVIVESLSDVKDRQDRLPRDLDAKSCLLVPLIGPHQTIGVLALFATKVAKSFSEWEVRVAQEFASFAAITLENMHFFQEVEVRSKALEKRIAELQRHIAELTHEVKAPAGRVAEYATWIEEDNCDRLDEKTRRYLAWIRKEGQDLAALAEHLLNFEQSMQLHQPLQSVDSYEVIQDILSDIDSQYRSKGVRIIVHENLPHLACYRIHVKQVFENLIQNALKYLGEQPDPRIEIGVQADNAGPLIFVRDNGIGIDPTMQDRIFLPFQRIGDSNVAGAGMGLSIVKTVVEHYGGRIHVVSTPGEGSTFFVGLPTIGLANESAYGHDLGKVS